MKFVKVGLIVVAVLALAAPAWGWSNANRCTTCHPSLNPNDDGGTLHSAHATFVSTCGYCHPAADGGLPVSTKESFSGGEFSCNGCHVLEGVTRFHGGVENCGCHGDPGTAYTENTKPPYYGTAATSYEDWRMCFDGLDNDGDGPRDGADTDCAGVPATDTSWSVIKQIYGDE